MTTTKETIEELLADEIQDLYSAEVQLTKAIPKMAKGSNDEKLKKALLDHLKETEGQVQRLENAASILGVEAAGKKCKGMEGVIKEGAEALGEEGAPNILDLGIIGAGTRVEHYEMAGYLTAIALAKQIGQDDVAGLLQESLTEEENAEKTLRKLASGLMKSAASAAAA